VTRERTGLNTRFLPWECAYPGASSMQPPSRTTGAHESIVWTLRDALQNFVRDVWLFGRND
jgi:hypothetical protein